MSSKEERRRAAANEMARRNRQLEAVLLQEFDSIDWGNAAILSDLVKRNVIRLGGRPRAIHSGTATESLVYGIEWPDAEFQSSTELFKMLMKERGILDFEDANQYVIEDSMPHRTIDFCFLPAESAASFWEGWQAEFKRVDSERLFPFGSDGHYFLLISENPADSSDPLLWTVDHEDVREEPYHPQGATVGKFLATLQRSHLS